jgi:hypothetical protein
MGDTKQRDITAVELIDLELIRRFMVIAEELHFARLADRSGWNVSSGSSRPAVRWPTALRWH